MKWLAALVLLAGCDKLFSVTHVNLEKDGAIDAPTDASIDAPEACPSNYVVVENTPLDSRYRYIDVAMPWDAAAADCVNDSRTRITHLIVFDDVAEMVAIRAMVPELSVNFQVSVGYARDTILQGGNPKQFTSVTGIPLPESSPLWRMSEPDNGGTGGAEETILFFERYADLTDGPANFAHPYICECDHVAANQVFHTID